MKTINELYLSSLEWFKEAITGATVDQFKTIGEVRPVFFAMMPTGKKDDPVTIAICPLETFGSKNNAARFMQYFVKTNKPLATAFVAEMWVKRLVLTPGNKKSILENIGDMVVSEEPDRVEGVIISLETYDMECQVIFEIKREGEATLHNFNPMPPTWQKTDMEAPQRFNAIYKKAGINWSQHINDAFTFSDN